MSCTKGNYNHRCDREDSHRTIGEPGQRERAKDAGERLDPLAHTHTRGANITRALETPSSHSIQRKIFSSFGCILLIDIRMYVCVLHI